jgi:hypothetical protein
MIIVTERACSARCSAAWHAEFAPPTSTTSRGRSGAARALDRRVRVPGRRTPPAPAAESRPRTRRPAARHPGGRSRPAADLRDRCRYRSSDAPCRCQPGGRARSASPAPTPGRSSRRRGRCRSPRYCRRARIGLRMWGGDATGCPGGLFDTPSARKPAPTSRGEGRSRSEEMAGVLSGAAPLSAPSGHPKPTTSSVRVVAAATWVCHNVSGWLVAGHACSPVGRIVRGALGAVARRRRVQ